jgi:PAS domain S-box-containing protein
MGMLSSLAGGIFMGLGIASMHYIGMAAMRLEATAKYNLQLVALSIAIAIAASLTYLWLAFQRRAEATIVGIARKIGSALIIGSAIAGMHYTAMAAVSFKQANQFGKQFFQGMDTPGLAITIGFASLIVLTLALLACLVERRLSTQAALREMLSQSEERFRLLVQHSSDIIKILEADGTIRYESPSIERILGHKPEDLVGKNQFEYVHPEDVLTVKVAFENVIQKPGIAVPIEYRFQHADNSWVYLESVANNRLCDTNIKGIVINSRDITSRKQAEAQLQQALEFEAMLKRITDKVRDSLDESQILQTVVQELCLVLGVSCCNTALYNLEQGTSIICYEYATSKPGAQSRVVQQRNFPEIYKQLCCGQYFQFCSIVPNPIRGRVAMLACPIFDNQGVLGDLWLINQQDYAFNDLEIRLVQQVANQCAITIRQAWLYQAATAQVKELEKLNQLKDDFLSTVSHELRTPVCNMKMAIHMLKIAQTAQAQERYLEILQNECAREIELINNLLDLQRVEAASYSISDEVMILQDWLPTIIESYEVRTQERQQILRFDLPPSLLPIVSDSASLGRILAELLNNACKYTPEAGEIAFRIRQEPHPSAMPPQPTTVTTIFTITNKAEIPATELPRIFEKFYRVPNADPWRQGGTGLGLALVQKLVKELKGTIKVESSKGWTTFAVQLTATVAVSEQLNSVKIKGGRVCT